MDTFLLLLRTWFQHTQPLCCLFFDFIDESVFWSQFPVNTCVQRYIYSQTTLKIAAHFKHILIIYLCYQCFIEIRKLFYYHIVGVMFLYFFNRTIILLQQFLILAHVKAFDTDGPKYDGGILVYSQRQSSPFIPLLKEIDK